MKGVPINSQDWPILRITMPAEVDDGAEVPFLETMQALLDRGEPYVVIMDGVEQINSPTFNSAYMKWFKTTKEKQSELCAGLVRVEAEGGQRKSLLDKAKIYIAKAAIPYPYDVCASFEEAEAMAAKLLKEKQNG